MKAISKEFIEAEYKTALKDLFIIIAPERWAIKPAGIELSSHKTKYGRAYPTGMIDVNEIFVGSKAVNKLRSTIRHELTHLCVGLAHNHNSTFKRVANVFGVDAIETEIDELEINQLTRFKYALYAILTNGEKVKIGGAHRKTKKYYEYPRDNNLDMSLRNQNVMKFEYVEL